MQTTVYPSNFDYSDDYFSFSSTQLFNADESWDFEMLPSNDTLPHFGLDVLEDKKQVQMDSYSDTLTSDDEVLSTPPPSSPNPFLETTPKIEPCDTPSPKMEVCDATATMPVDYQSAFVQMRNNQLFAQYQQQLQQYQMLLRQKLFMSIQVPPMLPAPGLMPPMQWSPPMNPVGGFSYEASGPSTYDLNAASMPYDLNAASMSYDLGAAHANGAEANVKLTPLDASHFGSTSNGSFARLTRIPLDISGNLTDNQYNKIFKKYHLQLQLDSHPIMTEKDLEDVKANGRMYFLKNVKTIVPKIGPWKFNAHISHRRIDERQYNIPGLAITCKVKEWLTDDGLWRLYHYKKGKTVKPKNQ